MIEAGELKVLLGFDVDDLKLNEFIKDLGDLNLRTVISAAGFGAMVKGIEDIMGAADKLGSSLNSLTAITGISQGVFQQWENVASQANVTAGVASQTISDIQKNMALFGISPEATASINRMAQLFKIQNITTKSPQEILKEELQYMEGMDPLEKRRLLNMVGQNEELTKMVGYEGQINAQVKSSQDSFDVINKYHHILNKLSQDWNATLVDLGAALAPILTFLLEITDRILDSFLWLEQHTPEWVKDLTGALLVLLVMVGVLTTITSLFAKILEIAGGLRIIGTILAGVTPLGRGLAIAGAAVLGAGTLYEMLKPNTNNSNVNNGGDFNQTNNYSISGNDPNSIVYRLKEYHEGQQSTYAQTQSVASQINY